MADRIADPLFGKPPERAQLGTAPLVRVLGQVQFARIVNISKEQFIGDFQNAVRRQFPVIERDVAQSIDVSLDGGGVASTLTEEVIWRMFDPRREWRLSLAPSALTLETMRYTSREEFLGQFQLLIDSLAATIQPSLATRVGFRYVNRIDSQADVDDLGNLVEPELLGLSSATLRNGVQMAVSQAQCQTAEGLLLARWGLLPAGATHDPDMAPPSSVQSWFLDIDSFTTSGLPEDGFTASPLIEKMNTMADRAYAFFRWSVKPRFLERFKEGSK
ncbi:TIGR04255 family protein [Paracoccus yeei]|uniref:TIGR04255 family protein n=1 Tax=Paracoccus yeei TaxID=147645 RepID=UPI00174C951A|nr:TIGR04255 family protein [Paracoccus yeei]